MVVLTKKDEATAESSSLELLLKTTLGLYITLVSIFFYLKNRFNLKPLGITFLFLSIYFLIVAILNPENTTISNCIRQFVSMSLWIYVYLFTFTLFSKYDLTKYWDKIVIIETIYFSILFFYNYWVITSLGISFALIEAYICIMMLPFILLVKKKKNILIALLFIIAILSGKRTGTLALSLPIIYYIFTSSRNLTGKIKAIFTIIFIALLITLLGFIFFEEQFTNIIDRFQNIQEDKGSGRTDIFAQVIILFQNSLPTEKLFGHGYNTVIAQIGYSAHNDFLEVIYDYGYLGFILYIAIYFSIIGRILSLKQLKLKRNIVTVSFILFLIVSSTSHLILFPTSMLCLCSFWGIVDSKSYINSCL